MVLCINVDYNDKLTFFYVACFTAVFKDMMWYLARYSELNSYISSVCFLRMPGVTLIALCVATALAPRYVCAVGLLWIFLFVDIVELMLLIVNLAL